MEKEVVGMDRVYGLIGVVAWSETRWKGFDRKGYENRKKYGFKFVQDTGYAHEWWNFYENFSEKYYISHIETGGKSPARFQNGPIIFISRNIYDGKWYFVGFYGEGEYDENRFETYVKIKDLIPSDVLDWLRNGLNETKTESFRDYINEVLKGITYKGTFRGNKNVQLFLFLMVM